MIIIGLGIQSVLYAGDLGAFFGWEGGYFGNFSEICIMKLSGMDLPAPFYAFMELTANIIASHLGGVVEGNGNVLVGDFSKIESARPGTITFLANLKYAHHIYAAPEGAVVLVSRDFKPEQPVAATLIRVDDPYGSLAQLLGLAAMYLKPARSGVEEGAVIAEGVEVPEGCYIGAMAYISPGVKLGKNVKIYPQAYIGDNVTIGDDTIVYPGARIYYGCRIGARCIIHAGAVIGADGFGFAPDAQGVYHKIEQIGIVVIEDDVEIGANATVDRSTMGCTLIHKGVKIDNLCQIAHNVEIGEHTAMAAQVGIAGSTHVGKHCIFGRQVGVAGHITIGDGAQLGAQAGIPNSVAPGSRLLGSPGIPAGEFARSVAYTRRLRSLFDRVDALEKELAAVKANKSE